MKRGSKKNRWLDLWVGTPALNLLSIGRIKRPPPDAAPVRIGVMCSPALGDTLLFSGALQDLRSALPMAHITHLCMRQNLAAAEIIPGADERLVLNLTNLSETLHRVRERQFEVLLDFTSWQRLTAFYTMMSGARYTVGFRTPGQHRSRGFDRTIEHRSDLHEVGNFRALLRGSGIVPASCVSHNPAIVLAPLHGPEPYSDEFDIVTLHLWASGQRAFLREWPEERWIELATRLAGGQTLFLITGAPSDVVRMKPFAARLRQAGLRAEAFVSPDGFQTLARVLLRSRLVVTVNTGVMHLAAIAGARTVAINGPNRNGRWGPVGARAVGVEAPGQGCGFLHLGFNFDGNPEDCMERISVEMVLTTCRNLLLTTSGTGLSQAAAQPPAEEEVS